MNRSITIISKNKPAWIWSIIRIFFYYYTILYDFFYRIGRKTTFCHTSKNMFRKEILHKLTAYFYPQHYSIFELSYKVSDEFALHAVLRDSA